MSAQQESPNILFLFTDQQRPDWLGSASDIPVETPEIDRLADQGVQFTDAICPSPVCNPSRAAIASGYEYDRCGVPGNSVDYQPRTRTTLASRLRDEGGYHTMACGKFDLTTDFPFGRSGRPDTAAWGYEDARFNPAKINTVWSVRDDPDRAPQDPYTAFLQEEGWLDAHADDYIDRHEQGWWTATEPTPLPDEVYYDNWITEQGLKLLEDAPTDQPWFLQVNFQNLHHPWDITEGMHQWYRSPDVTFPLPVHSDLDVDDKTHQEIRRNYAAMAEHLDACVGRFIDAVRTRGELENTLIVFSSDHGEMLGDYGQWQKLSPLQMSVGVPLIAAGAGVTAQAARDEPTTILDLHDTFLDVAGISQRTATDSRTLLPAFADEESYSPRDIVYSGLGPWRLVYDGQYKLIEGYDPAKRRGSDYEPMVVEPSEARRLQRTRDRLLFDVTENEHENLADEHPEIVERLHDQLVEIRDLDPE